ncbi:hypothetical protein KKE34_01415 [Patescibacteria group bacterium]|nr:hypothetical protein [Patescibacteria group bacterium]MBU1885248.1 hypothetical protein [Patescibacteria group bacterium]
MAENLSKGEPSKEKKPGFFARIRKSLVREETGAPKLEAESEVSQAVNFNTARYEADSGLHTGLIGLEYLTNKFLELAFNRRQKDAGVFNNLGQYDYLHQVAQDYLNKFPNPQKFFQQFIFQLLDAKENKDFFRITHNMNMYLNGYKKAWTDSQQTYAKIPEMFRIQMQEAEDRNKEVKVILDTIDEAFTTFEAVAHEKEMTF